MIPAPRRSNIVSTTKARVSRSRIVGAAFEAESHASNSDYSVRHAHALELLAQPTDGDVERLRRAVPVLVPHVGHQPTTGDHLVPVGGEDAQHLELLAGERDLVGAGVDPTRLDVDAHP